MVTLQRVIEFLHPNAVPEVDYSVLAHKGVERITRWSDATLGPQPTPEQLAQVAASPEFLAWFSSLPKKRKKAEIRKLIMQSKDPLVIALRGITRVLFASLVEVRREFSQLRADVKAANIPTTAKATPNRSFDEATEAALQASEAEVDAEQNP